MKLPAETDPAGETVGRDFPFCVRNYTTEENMIARVDPIFSERKFSRVPVRVIINKEGKIKHIHFLSAFDDQAKVITDALVQWRFKPYRRNGQPVEVETGITFGPVGSTITPQAADAANRTK
jgi:Gram-negative bacterial TonB protein C-terminal